MCDLLTKQLLAIQGYVAVIHVLGDWYCSSKVTGRDKIIRFPDRAHCSTWQACVYGWLCWSTGKELGNC